MIKIPGEVCLENLSRRALLKVAASAAGTIALVGVAGSEASADSKMTKAAAQYQSVPHSGQSCSKCQNYVYPNTCKQVEGPVSPNGWCTLFNAKT